MNTKKISITALLSLLFFVSIFNVPNVKAADESLNKEVTDEFLNEEEAAEFLDLDLNRYSPIFLRLSQWAELKIGIPSAISYNVLATQLSYNVNNSASATPVHVNLYRNGSLYSTGPNIAAGAVYTPPTSTVQSGYYHLELVCGNRGSSSTKCQTRATITGN